MYFAQKWRLQRPVTLYAGLLSVVQVASEVMLSAG